MDKIDRVFLMEYVQSLFMGHTASASTLYDGGVHAEETAAKVRMNFERIAYDVALRKATRLKDASRIQTVMIAKLLSEFVSSMEDFGALCYAIKGRGKGSIFKNYAKSFKHVDEFFCSVNQSDSQSKLDTYLSLPSLESLQSFKDKQFLKELEFDYVNCAETIRSVANMYHNPGGILPGSIKDSQDYLQEDVIYIVLSVKEKGAKKQANLNNSGILVRAYNKIKHRFLVFDDLKELLDATQNYVVDYAFYPRDPRSVEKLYMSIYAMMQHAAELAAIMIKLEEYELL